jgi:hypothetical protein
MLPLVSLSGYIARFGWTPIVINESGEFWVRFKIRQVPVTRERPHGLDYSLTLHGKDNERLVGFDNAHLVRPTRSPRGKGRAPSITSTDCERFARTNIVTQPRCLRTSGVKWTRY